MRRVPAASLFAVLVVLLAPGVAPAQVDTGCFITNANQARAAKGLAPLSPDSSLASIAATHAQKMAAGGQTAVAPIPNEEIVKMVPAGFQLLGQNVGSGGTCEAVASNFANLPAEQNRVLDSRYDRIGVGVAQAGNFLYVHEIFLQSGTPRGSPAPTASPATKPTPTAAKPSPSPTVASTEAAPSPSPTTSPSPTAEASPSPTATSETPLAGGATSSTQKLSLIVAFVLAIVAAAALGAFVQSRRGRG